MNSTRIGMSSDKGQSGSFALSSTSTSSSCWKRLMKSKSQRQHEYVLIEQKEKEQALKESVEELNEALGESEQEFARAQMEVTKAKRVALFHNSDGNTEEASAWAYTWKEARLEVERIRKEIEGTKKARTLVLKSERIKRITQAKVKAGKYVKGLTTDKQVEEHDDALDALDEASGIVDGMAGTSDIVLHEEKDKITRQEDEDILNRLVAMNVRQKKTVATTTTREHVSGTSIQARVSEEANREQEYLDTIKRLPESKRQVLNKATRQTASVPVVETPLNA